MGPSKQPGVVADYPCLLFLTIGAREELARYAERRIVLCALVPQQA